jgi:hypothetical protein
MRSTPPTRVGEYRHERLGEEEDALDVDVEQAVKAGLIVRGKRAPVRDACVKKRDVQLAEVLGYRGGEAALGTEIQSIRPDGLTSPPSSALALSALSRLDPVMIGRAPSERNCLAVSMPMPLVAPVISARFASKRAINGS